MSKNDQEITLKNKRKGFIMVSNDIVNNIKNGDAYLLWSFLSSKTDNWVIIKSFLCEHFGWSMRKLNYLFKVLCGHKLAKCYQEKRSDGKFGKYIIEIDDGENFIKFDEKTLQETKKKTNKINDTHRYAKNRKAAKPQSGKSTATKYLTPLNTLHVHNNRASGSVNLSTYPDDFFPDDPRRELLSEHARRTNNTEFELLKKFEQVSLKYKTKSLDWQLTFEEFLIREKPKRVYENSTGKKCRYDDQPLYN